MDTSLRRHYPGQVRTVGGLRTRPLSPSVGLPFSSMLPRRSCQTWRVSNRRELLRNARLYLVCEERTDEFVAAALRGGVEIVQLRMKAADDDLILSAARRYTRICAAAGALLILNDRPDLVQAAGADGVHVGQDDMPV